MNDYTRQNKNSNIVNSTIQEMTKESKNRYSDNSESPDFINSKEYSVKKTAFTKIKYVQK